MRRLLLMLIAVVAATPAAAACRLGYTELIEQNRDGIQRLKVGMNKDDLFVLMSDCETGVRGRTYTNPYRVHTRKKGDDVYEILYYLTERPQKMTTVRLSLTVPIVLKNGLVIGWGQAAVRELSDELEGSLD